ncbi:hypothetical protein NQ314_013128 [Rhamnusium bicolor]|uniref:Far11/STRP N-terminal domain-containing protein n=1 Tax=Rhamnusium bicolor TaxID=1586634 RepID=A0AAV8X8U6_9CUCU|nr:hypothetical protein NQ314_013128 [Rhamnusium bicolor]
MDPNGNGKRGLPRLREIIRRQRQDSDGGGTDSPDLEFVYDDTDTHINEIAELYSYTEQPELQLNVKAFKTKWNHTICHQAGKDYLSTKENR